MFKKAFLRGRVVLYRKQGMSAKKARLAAGQAWALRVSQEAALVAAILPMMDDARQARIQAEQDAHRQFVLCRAWADGKLDAQNNAEQARRALEKLRTDHHGALSILKPVQGRERHNPRMSSKAKQASTAATRATYGARKDKTRWQGISTEGQPETGRTVKAGTAEKHELAELTARAKRRHTRKPAGPVTWQGGIRHNVMPERVEYGEGAERMSAERKALRKYLEK